MDVFRARDRLIDDCQEFTGNFADIHEKVIRERVDMQMARGHQWPDPRLSLNPNSVSGGMITDLVAEGRLHPECERFFQLKDDGSEDTLLRRHRHQREAIEAARAASTYVPAFTRPRNCGRVEEGRMGHSAHRVSASTLPRGTGS